MYGLALRIQHTKEGKGRLKVKFDAEGWDLRDTIHQSAMLLFIYLLI